MHAFSTFPRGWLRCRADFAADCVLNLDFIAPERDEIPFHLSLRQAEGVAVVNRRHADGWRREIVWPFDFSGGPVAVDLRFDFSGATLFLDGRRMGRFDALPRPTRQGRMMLRHGFPGLKRIAALRIDGGIEDGSLLMHCPALPLPGIGGGLNDRLEFEIQVASQAAPDGVTLALSPLFPDGRAAETLAVTAPVFPLPYADRQGLALRAAQAILPGRVWAEGAEALDVAAAPGGHDKPLSARITRDMLLAALERAAAQGTWERDRLAALNAIEHVRHARLLDTLSASARARLLEAAGAARLMDWLLPGHGGRALLPLAGTRDPAAAVPETGQTDPVETARLAVIAGLRGEGAPDAADPAALVGRVMAAHPLTQEQKQALLRVLVEPFCALDRMEDLARLARDSGLLPLPEGETAWDQTTSLPFDLAQGWFDAVPGRLDYLASIATRGEWAVTPAIGWTIERLCAYRSSLDGQRPGPADARRAVRSFLKYLDALCPLYWSRGPCRSLMAAMIAVLARPDLQRPDSLEACARGAIALWGLSPGFWAQVDAAGLHALPGRLDESRRICAALTETARAPAPDAILIDRLLVQAAQLGIADTERYRLDLLGPSGLPGGSPDAEALRQRDLDPDTICLRALTHPDAFTRPCAAPAEEGLTEGISRTRAAPDMQDRAQEAARRGLVAAYAQLPSSPLHALERRMMRQAVGLSRQSDPGSLQDWARDLAALSGPERGHAAITLALGLAAALVRADARDMARLLLAQPLLSDVAAARTGSSGHVGPAQALAVLARHDAGMAVQAGTALGIAPARIWADGPPDLLALGANPLHDTLVAVYSCRAHLGTRIAELRQSWLQELTARGVPWLIFTGDGDGVRDGDIVHLDAPDDYEGLPDKTLAMVRWVLSNSHVSRLLKVDDDCFLHVPAWFGDLAHLRHDYYGRALSLRPGQMNRSWHMAKSRTPRGRLGLDKSPEPARYADGGSGYMLSRHAMARLIESAESPEGQQLRQLSFMEDKLTGDLLALRGIRVSNEDYRTSVLRRSGPGGPLVPVWENGVLPFRGSPVKLVHLDDSLHQRRTQALSQRAAPLPGKIWPSFQPPLSGSRSNTLDLLSPPSRLAQVRRAPVAVVACLRNEVATLPAFLDHYRRLGVQGFLIADNGSDDGTLELLAQAPDVALFAVDTEYGQSQYGVAWQQALLANFRVGKWSLMADADEFLVWTDDPEARLPDLLSGPGFADADAARVLMLDMYPRGPLSAATLASGDPFAEAGFCERTPFLRVSSARGPYSDAETLTSALRHRLIPGARSELFVAQKIALLRYQPWMRLSAGLHYAAEIRLAPQDLLFAHFKYTAAFHHKVQAEVARGQHFNDAEEYRKYQTLLAEGREVIFDPALSVPWRNCIEVERVFAAHARDALSVQSGAAE